MKRIAVLILLVLLCVAAFLIRRPQAETSLFALAGDGGFRLRPEVLERGSGEIQAVFHAPAREAALAAAEAFYAGLDLSDFRAVRFRTDGKEFDDLLAFYRDFGTGVLTAKDSETLLAGKYGQLARQALRGYHSALLPLFTPAEDPFLFRQHFLQSLPSAVAGWSAADGVMTAEHPDGVYLLMALSLYPKTASDMDALVPLVGKLTTLQNRVSVPGATVSLSGVPLHTAETAGRCKREIAWLSFFSLLVIAVTARAALRSFRRFPAFLYVLALAGLAGTLAVLVCCAEIHLLSAVFATSLLGLTVDYAFHGTLARAEDVPAVRRNLLISWGTTELSFLPLVFSGMPVLVQSAVFLAAGLTAGLLGALALLRAKTRAEMAELAGTDVTAEAQKVDMPPSADGHRLLRGLRYLPSVLFLGLMPLCALLTFGTDVRAFYTPSEALARAEKQFRDLTFSGEAEGTGLLVTEGQTLEEMIVREEAAVSDGSLPGISRFLPSLTVRQERYEALKALYASQVSVLAEVLGMERVPELPAAPEAWTAERIPSVLREAFLIPAADGALLTVIPNVLRPAVLPEGVTFAAPQAMLNETLEAFSGTVRRLLMAVGVLLGLVVLIKFRMRAFKLALPSLLAVEVVFLSVGLGGGSVNLFHLLACFMLIGMTLDYTVFFASGARRALKPVTCSVVTSLAGFGALAFVSFTVVRSVGQVFAVGLVTAYVSAWLLFWNESLAKDVPRTEVGASVLGITVLLGLYRLFGKRVLDVLGQGVAGCVWLTSSRVRRFTRTYRRFQCFVQAMIDKTAVMVCGPGQPIVEAADDGGTRAFLADTAAGKGVFVLSSHFGAAEVLPALANGSDAAPVMFHAFMHVEQTGVFNRIYLKHFRRKNVVIRPVSGFGVGEVFEAGALLDDGHCILMAGDRPFGKRQMVEFLGAPRAFPKGVFRFAALLEHPVYFLVCYRTGHNRYRVAARPLVADGGLLREYAAALEPYVRMYPEQWYNWEMLS